MSPVDLLKPLPLISLQTILQEPLLPVEWLVEPLIAKGNRVVVYGEFGSMKSWLLLHLALHLAAGLPWLGKFPIAEARRVLYIDEEMNERTLRRRIQRLARGAGIGSSVLEFRAMSRVGVRFHELGGKALLSALEKSQFDPDVIIVEAFRRVLVGSENDAEEVAAFWRNVEPILKAGKTLIISHHMRKPNAQGNNANRDRASGSTDILGGADDGFAVQRSSKDSVVIECIKCREAEETSPFVVSLYDDGPESPVEMRYEGSHAEVQAETGKLNRAVAKVLSFLVGLPTKTAKTSEIISHLKAHGFAQKTAERALKSLSEHGGICRVEHGVWTVL